MNVSPSIATTPNPVAVENDLLVDNSHQDEDAYVRRVLETRDQIQDRSRKVLKVQPEVAAEIAAIPELLKDELIRLAIRRSRLHRKDRNLLLEDVEWAQKRLISGPSSSVLSSLSISVGGIATGIGAPMLLGAALSDTSDASVVIQPATVGGGSIFTVVGIIFLAIGFISGARRH